MLTLLKQNNISYLLVLFALPLVFLSRVGLCDVKLVNPSAGSSYSASGSSASVPVSWIDDSISPSLSDIESYTFTLCSGPNSKIEAIKVLAKQVASSSITDDAYTVSIPNTVSQNGVYFIQVFAKGNFGYTIHYSNRFSLTGMSGTIVASDAGGVSTPPTPQYMITTGTSIVATINSASFTIPYPKQSGISKFAPMQTQPLTTINTQQKTAWTRRYPTSEVTYYTSLVGSVNCETTITAGWTYTLTSDYNYQTPNAGPESNGGWYDPRQRMTLSARKINAHFTTATTQSASSSSASTSTTSS